MTPHAAYEELVRRSRERAVLGSCIELLGWDELTYMPHGGVTERGRQTAHLAGLQHRTLTDPRLGELFDAAARHPEAADPHSPVAVNLREWRRTFDRELQLPQPLVEELASVTTTAQQAWADARQNDDFRQFEPWLARVLQLKRSEAECLKAGGSPYDSLLDDYEPGVSPAELSSLFAGLRVELTRLLAEIRAARPPGTGAVLKRSYSLDRQRLFAETVAADLGFDFARGRIDVTTHPFFSVIGPGDCRIATRFSHTDFSDGFFSTLHETGHALYEQGLDPADHGTPFGESPSMGLHESQSRFWELFVGRSGPFWQHYFPRARETFHDVLHDVRLGDFFRAVNHVQPGWNRVRADAATYDLHILVRFELEQALISGDLPVGDLPGAWNERYRALLGVTPQGDAEGCLQDGHWGAGQFGYFPTYTLGNLYAAQLYERARSDLPDLDRDMSEGEFAPLRAWLHDRVWRHGRRYSAAELVRRATGEPPTHRPFLDALRRRYSELYGIGGVGSG